MSFFSGFKKHSNTKGYMLVFMAFWFLFSSCEEDPAQKVQVWPEVTNEMKPWTRWWWMGSAVNESDLTYVLEDFAARGIGGVEIAPIYGAKGYEDQYIDFLSPRWMEILQFVVQKSNELGMEVDMTNGTGWPFGGPHITNDVAARRLIMQEYQVSAGQSEQPLILLNDQRRREYGAPLIAITAYGPNGEIELVTDYLNEENKLTWQPKSGTWDVIAAFNAHNRMLVKRAAPGGEGYTFDHLNAPALSHYLSRFDEVFEGRNPGLRCFFNDSYEVFGASWSYGFLDEFNSRRGYDLRHFFRELNGQGDTEIIARVKSDYRQTMSELLIQNFSSQWTAWANNKGAKTRNQSHGSPANLIDVYATVDIPEIETFGGEYFPIDGFFWDEDYVSPADHNPLFLKLAASAANITGKRLVSCETFTWVGEHFRVPLSQCKPEAEQVFLSGVNHIFYHGSTYSPQEAMWPGWLFYASVHFGPTNSFWPHVSGLNEYITRCQSILQQGTAANDILVYWPLFDTWQSEEGLEMMMAVHGSRRWLNLPKIQSLLDRGYAFDFVSDSLLGTLTPQSNKLLTIDGQNAYSAIVVPKCHNMPLKTLKKLIRFAENGVPVIFENLPKDVPGLSNLEERRNIMRGLLNEFSEEVQSEGLTLKRSSRAEFILSDDPEIALAYAGVERERFTDVGLKYLRRHSSEGLYYYLVNHTPDKIDAVIPVNFTAKHVIMLDPQTGDYGLIPANSSNGKSNLKIQARSGEAYFLLFTDKDVSDVPQWNYRKSLADEFIVDGEWEIEFFEGGPSLPESVKIGGLKPWTELGNAQMNKFSGTARYTINFNYEGKSHPEYLLDLGNVMHSARVILNGNDLGLVWSPPYIINVGEYLKDGENVLEIEVANLMANRIRNMDINNIEWQLFHEINFVNIRYRHFDASDWEVMPSGLEGPVKIIPQINIPARTPGDLVKDGKEEAELVFNFGSKQGNDGYYPVQASSLYNQVIGYGFDFGTKPLSSMDDSSRFFF
ncbi:glycosyl hydrolase [Alkalitalea saponilacus]|uniref:Alpha-L-rhamnosidase n=1 Tax=Alkalitalea saponilacus TaxID=889453 RepID=A0A1T5EVC0_9BACT|nr:glycosyl hydrolase [Alkalitalea saponilacus]ASB48013.1 glycoside hydrolase [Alkalitalea saponilacus]SKB87887.1 hypothetical protein SAMN03080601_01411 [Alkalitalea saponilacus]